MYLCFWPLSWIEKALGLSLILLFFMQISVIIERSILFYKANWQKFNFVNQLNHAITSFKIDQAVMLGYTFRHLLIAKVINKGLSSFAQYFQHNISRHQITVIKEAMFCVKEKELAKLKEYLNLLACIGVTAPMVSMLLVVIRIYCSFKLSETYSSEHPYITLIEMMAICPYVMAFGLITSIMATIAYFYFKNRFEIMQMEAEVITSEFIGFISKRA